MNLLTRQIEAYQPCCEQETADRLIILNALATLPHLLTRENKIAHLTASSWIVNPARDKVLMAYHNIYQSWSWTGGHADGDADLKAVACREACEETGLSAVKSLSDAIFSLEVLCVEGHRKRGVYVAPHLHLNVTYLLCAEDTMPVFCKPAENAAVRWFAAADAAAASREPYMRGIFEKLNEKAKQF
ncbi:MAG: NUDIX hydrolase [Ruthenibacterium sp.]